MEGHQQVKELLKLQQEYAQNNECYLDMIGGDLYSKDSNEVESYFLNSIYNTPYNKVMLMENGGHYTNADLLFFKSMKCDGLYHAWELCDTMEEWPGGLFKTDYNKRIIVPKGHHSRISMFNNWLLKSHSFLANMSYMNGDYTILNSDRNPVSLKFDLFKRLETNGVVLIFKAQQGICVMCENECYLTIEGNCELHEGRFLKSDWEGHSQIHCDKDGRFSLKEYSCNLITILGSV